MVPAHRINVLIFRNDPVAVKIKQFEIRHEPAPTGHVVLHLRQSAIMIEIDTIKQPGRKSCHGLRVELLPARNAYNRRKPKQTERHRSNGVNRRGPVWCMVQLDAP